MNILLESADNIQKRKNSLSKNKFAHEVAM
jgi:hypothetical protein